MAGQNITIVTQQKPLCCAGQGPDNVQIEWIFMSIRLMMIIEQTIEEYIVKITNDMT